MTTNTRSDPARVHTIPIRDLLRDPRYQVRAKLDPGTVARYASAYKSECSLPPIKVAVVKGVPVVCDGWHRLAALERIGRHTVEAEAVEATEREAQWQAAQANLTHGLPLKSREVREVFRRYVRARKHRDRKGRVKSYREIAQDIGGLKHHTTIRDWTMKDFPKIAREMGQLFSERSGEPVEGDSEADFEGTVEGALHEALAAFRGVSAPDRRGQLVRLAQSILEEMQSQTPGEHWQPPEIEDF